MKTLLLDTVAWDLVVDVAGDIAVASEPYSLAQDAASAIRLFQGELWYDTTRGVPYFQQILGKSPPVPLLKAKLIAAALTVPDVASAKVFISGIAGRNVSGQVQVTSAKTGAVSVAGFGTVTIPPAALPSLDFSDPANSQFMPLMMG